MSALLDLLRVDGFAWGWMLLALPLSMLVAAFGWHLLPARITQLAEDSPGQMLVALDAAGTALLARITRRSCQQLALAVGDTVFAQVKGVALVD